MEVNKRETVKRIGYDKLFQYYYNVIDTKYFNFIRVLDTAVSKNVTESGLETRPVKSNGLWCFLLIPTILVFNSFVHVVPLPYKITALASVGILSYSILLIMFISISSLVLKGIQFGGCMPSLMLSALLIYIFLEQSLLYSVVFSATSVYSYCILLRYLLSACPKTFTIGEAMVVAQGTTLSVQMAIAQFLSNDEIDEESHLIRVVVYTVLSTVGLIVTALYFLKDSQRTLATLGFLTSTAAIFTLVVLHIFLGTNCIYSILKCIFRDKDRIKMFMLWLSLLAVAVVVLILRTKVAAKATTVTRKTFHVLAALVFMSGIISDVQFMSLAAGLAFGVIVFIEALRKSRIEYISPTLQNAFDIYSDEKDSGCFAVTPIYLYVGLACPLVLVPDHPGATVELLSGVLATGVGDTAASWFGERYGCNRWPDGNRTLEGTAFNILSQVITIYSLQMFELLEPRALFRATIAATVSGLVEAGIEQVDNLILPLVTIIAFQLTFFIS